MMIASLIVLFECNDGLQSFCTQQTGSDGGGTAAFYSSVATLKLILFPPQTIDNLAMRSPLPPHNQHPRSLSSTGAAEVSQPSPPQWSHVSPNGNTSVSDQRGHHHHQQQQQQQHQRRQQQQQYSSASPSAAAKLALRYISHSNVCCLNFVILFPPFLFHNNCRNACDQVLRGF